jgi:UDP-N-acetylmuramoyl-tripeptide--D-alanyl-D-alanine ligase
VTAAEAIRATGGRAVHGDRLPVNIRVATDTRTLLPGDTYLALRGDRFDGHAFVADALAHGAAAVVVGDASAVPADVPAIVVADTKDAYLALAAAARNALRARVVAITGSTGKTTTKTFLAQLLATLGAGKIVATPANENNEIGTARLFLSIDEHVDVVVAEFGARRPGDIATLVAVARPELGVLTNVGDAHLEIMGSAERLAAAKWELFGGGARAVLNAADTVSRERARTLSAAPFWFGVLDAGAQPQPRQAAPYIALRGEDELFALDGSGSTTYRARPSLPGAHNRANAAAACAAAIALGFAPDAVAAATATLRLPEGRYERLRVGAFDVIYDAYNASAAGTLATLDAFSHESAPRRIAVLSSMAELGAGSAELHERVGAAAARAGLTALLVGGAFAHDLERGARSAGVDADRIVRFASNADAVDWLAEHAGAGDVVLLKGSRMYHLEEVLSGLRERIA